MKMRHVLAFAAAALVMVMTPTAAYAETRFHADSGDSCRYGFTDGALVPRLNLVAATGSLTDRPTPVDPVACRDDGFFSVATFTAFAGDRVVDTQAVRTNNATVRFDFVLGQNSVIARIDRVVVQVCRHPLVTLPPSYCGRPAEYHAPF